MKTKIKYRPLNPAIHSQEFSEQVHGSGTFTKHIHDKKSILNLTDEAILVVALAALSAISIGVLIEFIVKPLFKL